MSAAGVYVFEEFNETFMTDLKVLQILCNTYNFNWLVNKNGKFAFRRKNVELESKIQYGFCKACKRCNIRTKDQLDDLLANKQKDLENITVNLNAYLAPAPKKIKKISKRVLKEYRDVIFKDLSFSIEHRTKWILENGIILNCYCKKSVPNFIKKNEKDCFTDEYFNKQMMPTLYGFIDLHYGILLIDNVNLTLNMNGGKFTTDNYGRRKYTKENDTTFRAYIQLGIPNTTFNPWHLPARKSKNGIALNRLYNETIRKGKYLNVNIKEGEFFTATNTFEIEERRKNARLQKRYERILNVHRIIYKPL